jgi:hypothetical protein
VTSSRYSVQLILAVLFGAAALVGASVGFDHYGLFREVRGVPRQVYRGERTTKYLLARRYVPANFDALMVGASISANWNTKLVPSPRIYNASISGANLSEEKLIADQVIEHGNLKWLVICLHPYLTMTHGRKTEYMAPHEYWSALGSVDLLLAEGSKQLVGLGILADGHNEFGDSNYAPNIDLASAKRSMDEYVALRKRSGRPHPNFNVAKGAFEELAELARSAQQRGAKLAVVFPPVYLERFEVERADWEGYWRKARAILPANTHYLNFNGPEFDAERSDLANFKDSGHLSRTYSDALVKRVGAFISER